MSGAIESQRAAMAEICSNRDDWSFHITKDPLVRFLRDRRLQISLNMLRARDLLDPARQSALIVCGGVGGEGIFLRRSGFADVTVTDLSEEALAVCRHLDPSLQTMTVNAENMSGIADSSYDLVFVQDGLHHLPRPALGFTEMLRVARTAVIVIEPYESLVGRLIGTEWEVHGKAVNYVFRWNRSMLKQMTLSYLLSEESLVLSHRLWDHNMAVGKAARRFPEGCQLLAAKAIYAALKPINSLGNMMVGVVVKPRNAEGAHAPASARTIPSNLATAGGSAG